MNVPFLKNNQLKINIKDKTIAVVYILSDYSLCCLAVFHPASSRGRHYFSWPNRSLVFLNTP